ncbi:unnamed protein product [Anisakis simplex]|uniref:Mitochodrial transcription termination factor n=1 Tax=Anisakis simplex TaxID=6269 RepID=A0A0M3JAQ0_ANISI|nr:unnamed protein product [Anisakis simplex]
MMDFSWMMEGILFAIVNRPGVNVSDLKSSFSFALQPRMLVKLLEIFEKCGCIEVCREMVTPLKLRSPFDTERLEYVIPKADCIERFSRIFHSITLSDVLTSNRIEYV